MMSDNARKVRVSLTEDHAVDENVRSSLQSYISRLTVPQKVEMASKGNREVRLILSRDPSSVVARALVISPRISETDVIAYAGSAQTNEDVLRGIAENREWSKSLRVKVLLVSNPRTPPAVALRFLGHLSVSDLSILARNRNVSMIIRREAKRRVIQTRK
ncbi:MAG TPA: hypothetical protein VK944_08715 [Candidatus Limnocylindria bacterium]|nr:hypothetical protein [Candidatus Limnocylindria bacterium]